MLFTAFTITLQNKIMKENISLWKYWFGSHLQDCQFYLINFHLHCLFEGKINKLNFLIFSKKKTSQHIFLALIIQFLLTDNNC